MVFRSYKGCNCGANRGVCVDCMRDFIDGLNDSLDQEKTVLLRTVEFFGIKNQAAQCMGELGELAAELTRHFFQHRDRKEKIAEEIADVQIMLEQMILHLGIEEGVVKRRLGKLKRLESRIDQAG